MRYLRLLCPALALGLFAGPAPAGPQPPAWRQPTIVSAAFSPDRRLVLAGYDDGGTTSESLLRLWDIETGKLVHTFPGHRFSVPYVAFTPDGRQALAADHKDSCFRLWDIQSGKEVRRFDLPRETGPCGGLSPDGKLLLTWAFDKEHKRYEFRVWEVGTGKLFKTFGAGNLVVRKITFAPNSKLALLECQRTTSDPGGLRLLDLNTGKEVPSPNLAREPCVLRGGTGEQAAFAPGGARILLDQPGKPSDGPKAMYRPVLWDLAGDKAVRRFAPRRPGASEFSALTGGYARAAAFAPEGERVATADVDVMLRVWDLATGKATWSAPVGCYTVAFSKDGQRVLALADIPGRGLSVQVRDATTGKLLHDVRCRPPRQGPPPPPPFVVAATFSVDHRLVLAGYNDGDASDEPLLRLWDARTGKLVHTFPGYVGSVPYVAFTPDGKQVIGADVGDGSYRAWDTRTGKAVRRFEASPSSFPSAGLSSDGKFLLADMLDATRRGNQLRLWEVSTGKLLKTFGGVGASKLIFTPDGQQAVLASLRHPFLIDLGTGKVFAPPRLAKVRGEPLTFAPDGKWLLLDETEPGPRGPDALDNLTLWDLKADKPIRRLARTAGPSEKPFATTWHARAVAFAPGGKVAITADVDGMLRLWDLGEGKEAWSTTADGYAVAFSKGGQQVLCLASVRKPKVTEVSVQVRDAATGKLLRNVPCER